MEILMAKGA